MSTRKVAAKKACRTIQILLKSNCLREMSTRMSTWKRVKSSLLKFLLGLLRSGSQLLEIFDGGLKLEEGSAELVRASVRETQLVERRVQVVLLLSNARVDRIHIKNK